MSFNKSFRKAVVELHLVIGRLGICDDITKEIVSFLPRHFWKEVGTACWEPRCGMISQLKDIATWEDKVVSDYSDGATGAKGKPLFPCKKCKIALYW